MILSLSICQRRWLDPLLSHWNDVVNIELFGQFSPDALLVVVNIIGINISILLRRTNITFHLWCTSKIVVVGLIKILLKFNILVVFLL